MRCVWSPVLHWDSRRWTYIGGGVDVSNPRFRHTKRVAFEMEASDKVKQRDLDLESDRCNYLWLMGEKLLYRALRDLGNSGAHKTEIYCWNFDKLSKVDRLCARSLVSLWLILRLVVDIQMECEAAKRCHTVEQQHPTSVVLIVIHRPRVWVEH